MAIGSKKDPDEYQLPEDEFDSQPDFPESELEDLAASPRQNRFAVLLRYKKILIALGLILAVFIVYELMGPSDQEQSQPVPQQTQQAAQSQQPSTTTQPAKQEPVVKRSELSSVANQNQQLRTAMTNVVNQVKANKAELSQVEDAMEQFKQNQQQFAEQMKVLNTALQRMMMEMQKLTAKKTKPTQHKRTAPLPVYHLKAVLPGRAWLESTKGKTVTVTLGDQLRGYGKINSINAQLGIVNTSSGKIIRYGSDDY